MLRHAVTVCALAIASQGLVPAPAGVPAEMAASLQRAIDRWEAAPTHVAVTASVVLADGRQWNGAAGPAAPGSALTPSHLIQIASITKTMTAAIILQLVDEGVLRLDDPLSRWLPPHQNVDPAITIRQLLNHTNGLANYTASAALGAALGADRQHAFTPDELLSFVGPPQFAPGTATSYTNTAFLLLGQIAERATGRVMRDLYQLRLWSPLTITEIYLPGFDDPPGPLALLRNAVGWHAPLDYGAELSIGHSAFGLIASASSVTRWGRALFSGDVISKRMQTEMRTLVSAAGNIQGETGAGLGIRSYGYLDRVQFGHSGGAGFGSSLLLFDPQTGITVTVLMNQAGGAEHFALAPLLLQMASS